MNPPLPDKVATYLSSFVAIINRLREKSFSSKLKLSKLLAEVMEETGLRSLYVGKYQKALDKKDKKGEFDNLDLLIALAHNFDEQLEAERDSELHLESKTSILSSNGEVVSALSNPLQRFLEEKLNWQQVSGIADDTESDNQDAVQLMTIHGSKGLEFPIVFVAGVENDLLPLSNSYFSKELSNVDSVEEERRLMYVAMTRAKEELYLTYAKNRMLFNKRQRCSISPFIANIEKGFGVRLKRI